MKFFGATTSGLIVTIVGTVAAAKITVSWNNKTEVEPLKEQLSQVIREAVDGASVLKLTSDQVKTIKEQAAKAAQDMEKLQSILREQQDKAALLQAQLTKQQELNLQFEFKIKAIAEAQKIKLEDDSKKIINRALINSDKVKRQLAPFYTPSMVIIGHDNSRNPNNSAMISGGFIKRPYPYLVDDRRSATKAAPFSFQLIASSGALDSGDTGLRQLLQLGQIEDDGRPNFQTPTTEKDWDELRESQNLLLLHGQLMVDEGLLAP